MPIKADADLARILAETRTIALLGASDKPTRASHEVMRFLLANGYQVHPVNPHLAGRRLLGCPVYPDLGAIPAPVDMVDVFRQARFLQDIVSQAIAIGAKILWTQLGVVDMAAAAVAERAGLEVVMDRCPAIELPRLRAAGLLRERRVPTRD
jgi:predicted CoA-binding protein